MTLLTNGFDPVEVTAPRRASRKRDDICILHAGEIYVDRDPSSALRAIVDVNSERRAGSPLVRMNFLGRDSTGRVAAALSLLPAGHEAVTVKDHVPFEEARQAMLEADILCVIQGVVSMPLAIPAKLYEYIAVAKPVLALAVPGSDIEWVLKECGATYRIADPSDYWAIKRAVVELVAEIAEPSETPALKDELLAFTREALARRLAVHLNTRPGRK